MSLIRAENLVKRIIMGTQTISILEGVNLTVAQGETLAITGISGSGKTTLLGILAGIDLPTEGRVFIKDQVINSLSEENRSAIRLKEMGFIFQNFQLLPSLNALENIALPLELQGAGNALDQARILLEQVGLKNREHHHPAQLSGGEQQRVAIARAFVNKPRILFSDEPTANLDQHTGQQISDLIFDMNKNHGTTLICVTHDPLISNRCHRSLKLDQGKIQ